MPCHYRLIKRVINKRGRALYFVGDGLWFQRISEAEAVEKLSTGQVSMWNSDAVSVSGLLSDGNL